MARLLLIDDDDTTRELLGLLLRADGWEVADALSGDAALLLAETTAPQVVLSDLQMPGISGTDLAAALRDVCGAGVPFLAMTATQLPAAPEGYDALLVKPFTAGAVREALRGPTRMAESADSAVPVLEMETFKRMRSAMAATQLRALYDFALTDAEVRVRAMETATDEASVRQAAHALKGSCGMIGALRLGALAAAIEDHGLLVSSTQSKLFSDLRGEISAVGRMLEELFAATNSVTHLR